MIMARYKISTGCVLLIAYITLLLIGIMCATGCGVRNVGLNKESSKNIQETEETSKGNVSKTSSSSEEVKSQEKTDKVDEKQDTKTTEEFNPDGSLKSRTTETSNSKSIDKSTKDIHSRKELKTIVDSIFTNKVYRSILITENKKAKDVEADKTIASNFGGWLPLTLTIGIIALLYYYIKRRS